MYSILEIYLIYLIPFRWDWCSTRVYFTTAVRELMKSWILTKIGETRIFKWKMRILQQFPMQGTSPRANIFSPDTAGDDCFYCWIARNILERNYSSTSPEPFSPMPSRLFHYLLSEFCSVHLWPPKQAVTEQYFLRISKFCLEIYGKILGSAVNSENNLAGIFKKNPIASIWKLVPELLDYSGINFQIGYLSVKAQAKELFKGLTLKSHLCQNK